MEAEPRTVESLNPWSDVDAVQHEAI
jgi:hypothetical protein